MMPANFPRQFLLDTYSGTAVEAEEAPSPCSFTALSKDLLGYCAREKVTGNSCMNF